MSSNDKGKLYCIPSLLGGESTTILNEQCKELLPEIKYFIVENLKNTRRFLKKVNRDIDINACTFYHMDKHEDSVEWIHFLDEAENGNDIALISDAGSPAIADPGNFIVELAHAKGIQVVPLVGPSSIILALMASGMNGQNFSFKGYLPIDRKERARALKMLERDASQGITQIFIETPYRNDTLLNDIIHKCSDELKLCIAVDLTLSSETIISKRVREWSKNKPSFHKRPAVFLLAY